MATLSVCLIVKNEEDCIEKCLNSLTSFADEICVYDTGSTDNTVSICKSIKKVKIIEGEWRDDFAWARNQSFSMAKCDYIMWVDADDIVDEKSQKFFKKFKNGDMANYDMIYAMYRYHVDENNNDMLHFYRERIFKRILYPVWIGRIHEIVTISAKKNSVGYYIPVEDAYVSHYKHKDQRDRNLKIFRDMESKNEIYRGRDWFYYGNELFEHNMFDEAITKYQKCLNTPDTWEIEQLNAAFRTSIIYKDKKKDILNALRYGYIAAACTKIPRADTCCIIGDIYRMMANYEWAKFWYEKAIDNMSTGLNATFFDEAYATWKPRLNLCLCEYELGNKEKAIEYNNQVLQIVPNNKDALHNKEVLEKINEK